VATLALVIGAVVVGVPWLRQSDAAADMGATEISGADPSDSDGSSGTGSPGTGSSGTGSSGIESSGIEQELAAGTTEVRVAEAGVDRSALARITIDPAEDVVLSQRGSAVLTAAGGTGPPSATSFVAVRDGVITVESSSPVAGQLEVLALFDRGAETARAPRLLPGAVAGAGVITVESACPVAVHLEVLALFDGGAETAGSLRLLPAAVQVVSTEAGIGTDALTAAQDVYVGGFAVPQGTPQALARITAT